VANYSDYEAEERGVRLGQGWITWFVGALLIVAVFAFAYTPSGYVVEKPGDVYDTLGTVEVGGDTVPLVDIPMEETFPTTGSLSMLTVVTVGNREHTASWGTVAMAWLNKSQAILPLDEVFPVGVTTAQRTEISQAQMSMSQQRAVAAALTVLGEEYTTSVSIVATMDDGPAAGVLEPGDIIESINAAPIDDIAAVREALDENGVDKPATISVSRAGVAQDLQVTPIDGDTGPIIGVEIDESYDFPFDVLIQLEGVGGPSAGQIFALAIIDKLTPGSITGGTDVAGTGTITEDGVVGAIGGIRQKMYGAKDAGAEYFLAPVANCPEVVGEIPDGLQVFAVETLSDSLAVLNTLSTGASTALLPRC
jgi:PDZ domain-containing protein